MPGRLFPPQTDIFETSQALTLILEMPGVYKGSVDLKVENEVLSMISAELKDGVCAAQSGKGKGSQDQRELSMPSSG